MTRLSKTILIIVVVAGAGALGWVAGRSDWQTPSWLTAALSAQTALKPEPPSAGGSIIYYRDPDRPAYSATPAKTTSGKDYVAVRAGEDVSFEEKPNPALGASASSGTDPKRIRFYRNPMGLPDTSKTPKKDSMGMDYLPVYEGEDSDDGSVTVSAGKIQKSGVRSEPAERRVLSMPLRAPGTIQLDERRISVVALRFEGFIESVENVTTGSPVRKGQPLMRVYGPNLSNAAAEYLSALGARDQGVAGNQNMKGAKRRLDNLGMPEGATAALEKSREVPVSIAWPAPQDGVILERTAVDGMRAAAGDVLFRIADTSLVWALIDLAERDLAMVSVGQPVAVSPRGMPGKVFMGKIALIYPQINKETRTGRVRVELDNPDGALMPDMYVDANIATGGDQAVVTVPDSAVIDSGEKQIVLLDKGGGKFEPRPVKLGRRGDGRVEIREGVSDGEKVVVSANFLIDAESNLKAALQGLDTGDKPQ